MLNLFKISFRNVVLHWRQSLAATISLAAGLISIVMFQGYMLDVERMYQETFRSRMMYGDVIVEHQKLRDSEGRAEPWNFGIKPEQQLFIQNFFKRYSANLVSVSRLLQTSGVVTNGKTSTIFLGSGVDVAAAEKIRGAEWKWNTLYGSPLTADTLAKGSQTVLLGQSLGKILGCLPDKKEKVMDAVAGYKAEVRPFHCARSDIQLNVTTNSGQLNALDAEVGGLVDALYKDVDDKYILMPIEAAQTLMNTQDVSSISAKMDTSGPLIDKVIEAFNQEATTAGIPQRMVRWQNHLVGDMYVRTMSFLSIFRNFVLSIIIVIATLSIFNTMMKLVKERTREIGTLRCLGFRAREVLAIFVAEAVILSFLGGVIGSFLAVLSTWVMNALGITYKAGILVEPVPMRILISPSLYVFSFIFLALLAALTTWLACRSPLQKDAVENLTSI